ncbi:MAG: hypothetical protein ACWA5A_08725 [Marinibacterium sp.]
MKTRVWGAALRAVLVAVLIATPSLLLPSKATNTDEILVALAIIAAILTFLEYASHYPSLVEFRDAPPVNRLRFGSLFCTVFMLTVVFNHAVAPTSLSAVVDRMGELVGSVLDFPYSPVRLVLLMLPADERPIVVDMVRAAAGLSYLLSLITIALFINVVRFGGWPVNNGVFNVWINLPLFDPTKGGDVVWRLQRDARINIVCGALLPFFIPAVIKASGYFIGPMNMANPNTLIWTISAWAFLPASMIIRGIAMLRIAELIENKRRRSVELDPEVQAA